MTTLQFPGEIETDGPLEVEPVSSSVNSAVALLNTFFLFSLAMTIGFGGHWAYQNRDKLKVKKKPGQTFSQAVISLVSGHDVSTESLRKRLSGIQ